MLCTVYLAQKNVKNAEDQKNVTDKGGTMRLGSYDCQLKKGSKAMEAYQKEIYNYYSSFTG